MGAMRKSTHTGEYALLRERLVTMRQDAGFSQRELARRLKVQHTWIAKVESGERRIDLVEFAWFCQACNADPTAMARPILVAANCRTTRRGSRS